VRGDLALRPKGGIQMTNQLMAVKVEIYPLRVAATFGAPKDCLIEASRLIDISHLQSNVKRRQTHLFNSPRLELLA
jgi:hypothetical protein